VVELLRGGGIELASQVAEDAIALQIPRRRARLPVVVSGFLAPAFIRLGERVMAGRAIEFAVFGPLRPRARRAKRFRDSRNCTAAPTLQVRTSLPGPCPAVLSSDAA